MTLNALDRSHAPGMDQLALSPVPLVPEMRLFLAEDAIVLWARLEAAAGVSLPAPYWASAWVGGQAVARYVLDHPESVAGRSVLDLASGSGIVAIAAAMAGATDVTATEIDPNAIVAIRANAQANGVAVTPLEEDVLDGDGHGAQVVLAGDVLYDESVAERVRPFLIRAADRGALVLLGDPDRGHLPSVALDLMASYTVQGAGTPEDAQLRRTNVFTLRRGQSEPMLRSAAR
ncbi:class I SAM-dependent methyltransferase [Phytohabitans aurantiacus]|jgi:predicted nicotinamide N-methyase|uniref:Nicotinamide N-methylase n=1 Tax=Phytohabitans aurantiacus TaxID=3016789 RepID=A0ABQ5R907_9ACTN|nr:50S ribosomal protein L11 methyltransferase [Phytohabitans aurantiacus]GLI02367.1 nicotinamide N-methylase [Phytohabitans aurantiacus]